MQAVVLAGGKGTRLLPYTLVFPKPMLPVGGIPIIGTIVRQLAHYGFDDIVVSLGYLGDYIRLYFREPANVPPQCKIRFFDEERPLGTAGPIALAPDLEDDFLAINGDILTTIDFARFMEAHRSNGAALSIAVGKKDVLISLGILESDEDGMIKGFREKPTYSFATNMGVYIYTRRALRFIPQGQHLDLNILVMRLLEAGEKVYGFVSNDPYYWIDVGQHADYALANEQFEQHRATFLPGGEPA